MNFINAIILKQLQMEHPEVLYDTVLRMSKQEARQFFQSHANISSILLLL